MWCMAAPPISKLKEDIGIQRDQRKAFLPLTSELLKRKHWPGRDRPGSPGSLFRKPDSQSLSPIKLLIEEERRFSFLGLFSGFSPAFLILFLYFSYTFPILFLYFSYNFLLL